jgi:HD-GYP domain-containing protein (c-di-GMP phosphodiesterase class II)
MVIGDKITDREMFKNSNLNKEETIMDRINNANNRITEIKKEQAEMYRPKTDAEIKAKFEQQNKDAAERLRKKMKDEPEDKADGGRIGFRAGKFVLDKVIARLLGNKKKVQQAVDDIFPTGDYKYDADMAADALVENNPAIFKNLLREDLPDEVSSEIYGAVLKPIMSNMAKMRELRNATKPEKTLASMKKGKGIDISDPEIAEEFTRFIKETDPKGSKTIEQTVELANFDPKKVKGNADGGRIGYYTGGITDVEPSLDDIGHGADAMMSRTRLMSPGSQTTTSTGLNYLLAEDNDNIRS